MGKRICPLLVVVMLATGVSACKPSSSGGTETPVPVPTDVPSVPPPTLTPTPVPPTPTSPTPVDVAAKLSGMELPADVIPASYTEFSSEDWGITPGSISDENLTVSKIILLMDASRQEVCMAVLFALDSVAHQELFDAAVADSDLLVDSLVQAMAGEGVAVTELGPMTGLGGLGDAAAGYAFQYEEGGLTVLVDVIIFRRGPAGAMGASLYLEDQIPQLTVEDLTEAIDAQFQAVFE